MRSTKVTRLEASATVRLPAASSAVTTASAARASSGVSIAGRAMASGRKHALHGEAHRRRLAGLGAVDHVGDDLLRVLGEGVLEREGLLVERAGRPAGRIAAVTWLKAHR